MASVYILYSKESDSFYIGSTKDISKRTDYHNNKEFKGSFTSRNNDWEVFFSIDDIDVGVARKVETHLKKMKSRLYLQNLKKYPEIAAKLIKKYSLLK